MRLNKYLAIDLAATMLTATTGCGENSGTNSTDANTQNSGSSQVVELKFANSQTPEETCSKEIRAFTDRVKERLNGMATLS